MPLPLALRWPASLRCCPRVSWQRVSSPRVWTHRWKALHPVRRTRMCPSFPHTRCARTPPISSANETVPSLSLPHLYLYLSAARRAKPFLTRAPPWLPRTTLQPQPAPKPVPADQPRGPAYSPATLLARPLPHVHSKQKCVNRVVLVMAARRRHRTAAPCSWESRAL